MDLLEVQADNGRKHLAMVFEPVYASHDWLRGDLQARLSFMERPDVTGVARLATHEPETGTFVYSTGTVWTVAEIVKNFAEDGDAAGVKAGLELCYLVAEILVEAAEAGRSQECPNHGNLNPWNVALKADGQPVVLGYGLRQVEIAAWREEDRLKPREDSFRYVPPERLEGHPEDLSSDLFALALIALEMMMGRPVYDGLVDDIKQQASRGEGMRRLYQWREKLPQNVREVLGRALKPDPDTRYTDPMEFVYAVHDLLRSIDVEGPNLIEVMAQVRANEKRGRAVMGGRTAMLSAEEMAELAADLEDFEDRALPPPRRPRPTGRRIEVPEDDVASTGEGDKPRWSRASRRGDPSVSEAADPAPAEAPRSGARERLRRRLRSSQQAPAEGSSARERLKRRLREGRGSVSGVAEDIPLPTDRNRRRRRRGAEPAQAPIDESALSVDLEGPDDVDLEEVTGALKAPVPLPTLAPTPDAEDAPEEPGALEPEPAPEPAPEPEPVASAPEADGKESAAAALLAKLRNSSGGRRRRSRRAPPVEEPESKPAPPPPPAPEGLVDKAIRPQTEEIPFTVGRTVEIALGGRVLAVPTYEGDRAAALALRAALVHGGIPTDPAGRIVGTYVLEQGGEVVASSRRVASFASDGPLGLKLMRAETRLVELEVRTTPPTRLRTPVSLSLPAGWLVAGLSDWLLLPPGKWAVVLDGKPVLGEVPIGEVLGTGTEIVVAQLEEASKA